MGRRTCVRWRGQGDLSDAEAAVCLLVVRAPEAWLPWADAERAGGAAALDALVLRGVLVAWVQPTDVAVTLSAWGAWALSVGITEEWHGATETRSEWDESRPAAPPVVTTERVMLETPVWDDLGSEADRRPIRLPRHGRIGVSLVRPERVAAKEEAPEPDILRGEDGEPVLIRGQAVRIDRRMRGRRG